eukprot:SAG31_NODE_25419_length_461_cov_2.834254_1_plen_50_part_10
MYQMQIGNYAFKKCTELEFSHTHMFSALAFTAVLDMVWLLIWNNDPVLNY